MSSTKSVLLILLLAAAPAFAAKLTYLGGTSSFELTKDAERMTYHSGQNLGTIMLRECNRKLVEQYWDDALTEFKKFPRAILKGTPPKRPYATLDGESRWITDTANSRLSVSPQSFLVLKIMEAKACKR